jgi:hypothetical protein
MSLKGFTLFLLGPFKRIIFFIHLSDLTNYLLEERGLLGCDAVYMLGKPKEGRDIAQAVSRRLPTAAVRVQTRVWSCGIL